MVAASADARCLLSTSSGGRKFATPLSFCAGLPFPAIAAPFAPASFMRSFACSSSIGSTAVATIARCEVVRWRR